MPNDIGLQVVFGLLWFSVSYMIYLAELKFYDPTSIYRGTLSYYLMVINLALSGFFIGTMLFQPPHLYVEAAIVAALTFFRYLLVFRKEHRSYNWYWGMLVLKRKK